jgi:hypothetical protein
VYSTVNVLQLTVVRIHINAPTLANMATAPAVPPRTALAEALFMTSRNVGGSSGVAEEDILYCFALRCIALVYETLDLVLSMYVSSVLL